MKSVFGILLYLWSLLRSCFAFPFRTLFNSERPSYSRLQELSSTKLTFSNASFSRVIRRARDEFQLVLLYLHNEQHQDADLFWDCVLESDELAEFVNSRQFLVKMMDIQTSEGYQLSQKLGVTSYPFLAVLLCRSSSPQLVARSEGVLDVSSIIETLQMAYDRYHPVLVTEQHDANERDLARQQREEQDRAFQEALEQDRLREQEERERQQREQEEKVREERLLQEAQAKKERIQRERVQLRSKYFNQNGESLEPAKGSDTCCIRFRFPNGSTLQRQFYKSDSVRALYELVYVLKPPMSTWEPSEDAAVEDFQLSTTYPKRILDMTKSIQEEKCANETLLVHEDV